MHTAKKRFDELGARLGPAVHPARSIRRRERTLFYLGGAAAGGESGDSYFRIDAGPKVKIDRSLVSFDQAERRYVLAPDTHIKEIKVTAVGKVSHQFDAEVGKM
jgi:hypothetical protein